VACPSQESVKGDVLEKFPVLCVQSAFARAPEVPGIEVVDRTRLAALDVRALPRVMLVGTLPNIRVVTRPPPSCPRLVDMAAFGVVIGELRSCDGERQKQVRQT
jgi:hypothetical protein